LEKAGDNVTNFRGRVQDCGTGKRFTSKRGSGTGILENRCEPGKRKRIVKPKLRFRTTIAKFRSVLFFFRPIHSPFTIGGTVGLPTVGCFIEIEVFVRHARWLFVNADDQQRLGV
jgi:hypothetical protein